MLYICVPTIKSRRDRLEVCVASIKEHVKIPHCIVTYENERGGFVPAIHDMLKGIDGVVWCIGDDTVVQNDAVDILWRRFHDEYPDLDGVVQPDDGIQHERIITMPMCHSKTMQQFTYKGYNHYYADEEFTWHMREAGKYTYVPEAVVEHAHWLNGKAENDEKYTVSMQKNDADKELFIKRMENGFTPLNI